MCLRRYRPCALGFEAGWNNHALHVVPWPFLWSHGPCHAKGALSTPVGWDGPKDVGLEFHRAERHRPPTMRPEER
jgi:hypothetical protein